MASRSVELEMVNALDCNMLTVKHGRGSNTIRGCIIALHKIEGRMD